MNNDFGIFEQHLLSLYPSLKSLSPEYKMLYAAQSLLFLTPDELAKSPVVGDLLPYSVALNFLFSRAPEALKSPHQLLRMSPEAFLEFVESKSETEKLAQIRECLESYASDAKKSGAGFPPVYSTMIDILQRAL